MRRFLEELKRRNVYKVGVTYAVVAFVTLQVAELLFPATTLEGVYDALVVIAFVGFPISLVLAWAFDVTPEGVQRTPFPGEPDSKTVDGHEAATSAQGGWSPSRLAATGLIALGLLSAAVVGGWYLLGSGGAVDAASESVDRSIAVLPFDNMGGEESRQFTEGVHDGLLTRLSKISDLKVISRTSVMQFQETNLPLPVIADSLDVRWVVEGAVQQAGGEVQLNAQLIQAEEDAHQWAETYQRELTSENVFAIQSELTKRIAGSLEAQLSSEERRRVEGRPTDDLEAYQLYVQGRREFARRSGVCRSCVGEAVALFQRAIEHDSTFALAWAGLADAAGLTERVYATWSDSAARPNVSQEFAAHRALELDPELAEARAAMGRFHLERMNAAEARREFLRAIELKPSYWEAQHWLGELFLKTGYPEEALEHLELAVELNPQHALARHFLYDAYLIVGDAERSLREARLQRRRGLEESGAIGGEVRALIVLDRLAEARRLSEEQVSELGPETVWGAWFRAYLVQILAEQGDSAAAREYLRELQEASVPPEMVARAWRGLGRADEALEAYGRMDQAGWGRIGAAVEFRYGTRQALTPVSDDPRYRNLLSEANRAWGLNPDGSFPSDGVSPAR